MPNPLDSTFILPPFSLIQPEHIRPTIERLINNIKLAVADSLLQPEHTWENLVEAVDREYNVLRNVWSPIMHLNSVRSAIELRKVHDECRGLISELSTWMGQHVGLYQAYESLRESKGFEELSPARQKVIENEIRDFKLSGVALKDSEQRKFAEIKQALAQLSSQFSNNLLDANKAYTKHITDESKLSGLPETSIIAAESAAQIHGKEGWLFTLDAPSYMPVMTYCDDQQLREELYTAYNTRASELGPNAGEFDNSKVMEKTLELRQEQALLLGFENFAELSVDTKMADSTQQVLDFLHELCGKTKNQAQVDMLDVSNFARNNYQLDSLKPWDIAYYSEKLKKARFAISDEDVRPYFPEHRVLTGLFTIANKLFGIKVKEVSKGVDTWHPDVRFFEIEDENNEHRGSFYMDLYARQGKRGGAWVANCSKRVKWSTGELQKPMAFLTCNFSAPVGDMPALFTHKEVTTIFHEFGHCLHFLLTSVDEAGVSGVGGVAWDAVELPSQFMENWCWQKEGVLEFSGHYQTGEPLPDDLLSKLIAAKNFQSSMLMVRQLELALFDFLIHIDSREADKFDIQMTLDNVRDLVAVIPYTKKNRFQHGFQHIFAGGYAAGYYSYKWAEVLSADAFSKFEEEGIFNSDTGKLFMKSILEKGGSEDILPLFVAFRGRTPSQSALLKHSGIVS